MKGPESTIDCDFKPKTLKKPGGFETGNTLHQWDYAKLRAAHKVLAEFSGARQDAWSWNDTGKTIAVSKDTRQMEIGTSTDDVGLVRNCTIIFVTRDWRGTGDASANMVILSGSMQGIPFAPEIQAFPALFLAAFAAVVIAAGKAGRRKRR